MKHQQGYGAARAIAVLGVIAVLTASPALAHHPLGGATPASFIHGLLSGLGHPVIGLDHLAFIVAVGIASAFTGLRYVAPAVFIGGTLVGCLVALGAGPIVPLEWLIASSVLLIGGMLLSGRSFASPIYLTLFAIAGVFHGGAYAEAIAGAEATPLVAYLIGFAVIQYAIAVAMTWVTTGIWKAASIQAIQPRLAGAVIAGVGATFFVEHIEKLAFPGM